MTKYFLDPDLFLIPVEVFLRGEAGPPILLTMALDTGASFSCVPWEAAKRLGCDPSHPKKMLEIMTASGVEQVPLVVVPRFQVWGVEINDIEVICLNMPPRSQVSGLLGLNVLKRFDLFLKFRAKTLEVFS